MSPDIPGEEPGTQTAPPPPRHGVGPLVVALLALPVGAALAVPLYARVEPRVIGVPFFYWYQFAALLLAVVCLAAALRITDRRRPLSGGSQPW